MEPNTNPVLKRADLTHRAKIGGASNGELLSSVPHGAVHFLK